MIQKFYIQCRFEGQTDNEYNCELIQDRLQIFYNTCLGVYTLHKNLITHCDLNPRNIVLNSIDDISVIDFGIAYRVTGTYKNQYQCIQCIDSMAPEIFFDDIVNGKATNKIDIFSLGILLLRLIDGDYQRYTFEQSSKTDCLNYVNLFGHCERYTSSAHYPPDTSKAVFNSNILFQNLDIYKESEVYDDVKLLIRNMLKMDPDERYDITQVLNDLQDILKIETKTEFKLDTYTSVLLTESPKSIIIKPILQGYRKILFDWLLDLTMSAKMSRPILSHAIDYLNRFYNTEEVIRVDLQLYAVVSLFISCNLFGTRDFTIGYYLYMTDNAYTLDQFFTAYMRFVTVLKYEFYTSCIMDYISLSKYIDHDINDKTLDKQMIEYLTKNDDNVGMTLEDQAIIIINKILASKKI